MVINKKDILIFFFFLSLMFMAGSAAAQHPPPQLESPSDGATNQPTSITFEWSAVSGADRYQIQIATDSNFSSSNIVFSDNTTSTSISLSGFSHNTTYYWRVRSGEDDPLLGGTAYGDWSEIFSFTTVEAPPEDPTLISPENGASDISTSPTLNWQQANRADTYQLQVARSSDFSSREVDQTGISSTETDISGLQHEATYYWRVRAENDGGTSDWSDAYNFTTIRDKPAKVHLVAPDSGATEITTSPRLEWEKADQANFYDLQIATDEDFNQKVINLDNVTSNHYDADLEGFSTYYWRVRGENDTGKGDWSYVWNFTTEQTGSAITIINPNRGDLWKTEETASIRWNATNNVEKVTIEYRLSSDDQWVVIAENLDADSEPYSWEIPDLDRSSSHAFIKVSDANNSDISGTSDPFMLYPSSLQLQQSFTFNSASSASDYKLVALPAQANTPIDALIPGEAGNDWNAYFDNGSQENYMVEFDGSDPFTLEPGRALFVISKNDFSVSKEASAVQLSPDTTYAIPLHEGWNMIANPFDVAIDWEKVQAKNDISTTIWGFEGKFTEASQFEPYKGYYFFNQDSSDKLLIPYHPSEASQKQTAYLQNDNKQSLTLNLQSGGNTKSSVQVGFDPTLTGNGKGSFQFAPPGDFQDYKLSIESKKFSGRQTQLAKAFFPAPQSKRAFTIRLKSKPGESVKIKAEGLKEFAGYEILLAERETSKFYDLKQQPKLMITPDQSQSTFLLVIGNADEVEATKKSLAPTKSTLSQNYPNPFNGQTVIEYSVPEHLGLTDVNLEIFDVLGRKVYTLADKRQSPGFYEVRWNGNNNTGRSLASGVYYYRLKVGQRVLTKKMTFIK